MSELVAKPIIKDQLWIVTDGDRKIGNIEANSAGFSLQMNGDYVQFDDTSEISKKIPIKFVSFGSSTSDEVVPYADYPTPNVIYNSLYDVTKGLHLFTKTQQSKCYHVAGWYAVNHNGTPEVTFCPKYIFVDRYPYYGPYKNEEDAKSQLNNL